MVIEQRFFTTTDSSDTSSSAGLEKKTWLVYIDGASRNNPGPAGAGIYIRDDTQIIGKRGFSLGVMTNNRAEYYALVLALFLLDACVKPGDKLYIYSDSQLLVRQMRGEYKIRDAQLQKLAGIARVFLAHKNSDTYQSIFHHIPRAMNTVADALANEGIDKGIPVPHAFSLFMKRLSA